MSEFTKKWNEDRKFRAKVKLILYVIFFVIVSTYALSNNNRTDSIKNIEEPSNDSETVVTTKITVPENYDYTIDIEIDDTVYKYSGTKIDNKLTIVKEANEETKEYIKENNEYYVKIDDNYIKTTKNEVYDIINYNYIDIDNINTYLTKATKNNNQYLVYLKDVILGNDSNTYFVITINDDIINIDYTPLMREFNQSINKYRVAISINEKE